MKKVNKNCGVYQIRNIVTKVCYAGQSIDIKDRERHHWNSLKINKHKNIYLQRSYNKHGKECFVFEVLIYCKPKDLTLYEQLFCDIDKEHNLSYNIRDCVDSNKGLKCTEETKKKISIANSGENHPMFGKHFSDETKKKMSEAQKGEKSHKFGKHLSKETCNKMSESRKGEKNHFYGKHHTDETCKKISKANSGENHPMFEKHHSDETCKKISEANSGENHYLFGKHHSEETCKKISENHADFRGENHPMFGRHHSEETKKKMSESKKGKNNYRITKKEIVLEVLELLDRGMSGMKIARKIGIYRETVYRIKNGYYDDIYDL